MVLHKDEIQFKSLKSICFKKKIILYKNLFNSMEDIKRNRDNIWSIKKHFLLSLYGKISISKIMDCINRYIYQNVLLLTLLNKILFCKYLIHILGNINNKYYRYFNEVLCNISTVIKYYFLIKIIKININKSRDKKYKFL